MNRRELELEQLGGVGTGPLAECVKYPKPYDPVAWLHVMDNTEGIEGNEPEQRLSFSAESPFGVPGVDHSETFAVTSTPLFLLTRPVPE